MMKTESPYADAAGRRIREHDAVEARYGYRYTVFGDNESERWVAVDSTGHHRIALERLVRCCEVVESGDLDQAGTECAD